MIQLDKEIGAEKLFHWLSKAIDMFHVNDIFIDIRSFIQRTNEHRNRRRKERVWD